MLIVDRVAASRRHRSKKAKQAGENALLNVVVVRNGERVGEVSRELSLVLCGLGLLRESFAVGVDEERRLQRGGEKMSSKTSVSEGVLLWVMWEHNLLFGGGRLVSAISIRKEIRALFRVDS